MQRQSGVVFSFRHKTLFFSRHGTVIAGSQVTDLRGTYNDMNNEVFAFSRSSVHCTGPPDLPFVFSASVIQPYGSDVPLDDCSPAHGSSRLCMDLQSPLLGSITRFPCQFRIRRSESHARGLNIHLPLAAHRSPFTSIVQAFVHLQRRIRDACQVHSENCDGRWKLRQCFRPGYPCHL
ncbi:hypothetical protein NEOLEDRAFT_533232 [Neolentinus lepideus HHB14362 ss-1]|uniref:Uncharacterized protein n=1 Tax=Neolentinus lepideus HHB14362 ss-1 TaxID=1314782 RepID=A0A165R9Q7_9AGAM|nr:hypothetical protein NEOLEDRAFT_533232 [Neolentinus lepideus HHB14362 ss-1]